MYCDYPIPVNKWTTVGQLDVKNCFDYMIWRKKHDLKNLFQIRLVFKSDWFSNHVATMLLCNMNVNSTCMLGILYPALAHAEAVALILTSPCVPAPFPYKTIPNQSQYFGLVVQTNHSEYPAPNCSFYRCFSYSKRRKSTI